MEFLRNAGPAELLALFIQWTGGLKGTFVSIPEITGLFARVQEDHDALVALGAGASAEATLKILQQQAVPLDASHDHYQRALRFGIQSACEILLAQPTPDQALVDTLEAVLAKLQPTGLEIIKASFEAEAGNARTMVLTASDPQVASALKAVPMMLGMTAADVVDNIGKVGSALGDVEQKKSLAEQAIKDTVITPAEILRRVRDAASTIETVLGALERSKAPSTDIDAIKKPILDAAEKARGRVLAHRAATKKAAEEARAAADKAAADKAAADKAEADKNKPPGG